MDWSENFINTETHLPKLLQTFFQSNGKANSDKYVHCWMPKSDWRKTNFCLTHKKIQSLLSFRAYFLCEIDFLPDWRTFSRNVMLELKTDS
jgi:hypothetical protein